MRLPAAFSTIDAGFGRWVVSAGDFFCKNVHIPLAQRLRHKHIILIHNTLHHQQASLKILWWCSLSLGGAASLRWHLGLGVSSQRPVAEGATRGSTHQAGPKTGVPTPRSYPLKYPCLLSPARSRPRYSTGESSDEAPFSEKDQVVTLGNSAHYPKVRPQPRPGPYLCGSNSAFSFRVSSFC